MTTRRTFVSVALGAAGAARFRQAWAQAGDSQQQGGLRDRGAPTGRTGAATRGVDGQMTLELAAPVQGVGLTSAEQPELCYLLSGVARQTLRLTVSTPGQARPLVNVAFSHVPLPGLGVIRLRDHGVRLAPNLLCVWSLTLALYPLTPSQDLVGSALIEYQPGGPALDAASHAAFSERIAALVRAGYWYDAVALAEQNQRTDHGAALSSLFKQMDLHLAANPGPR